MDYHYMFESTLLSGKQSFTLTIWNLNTRAFVCNGLVCECPLMDSCLDDPAAKQEKCEQVKGKLKEII